MLRNKGNGRTGNTHKKVLALNAHRAFTVEEVSVADFWNGGARSRVKLGAANRMGNLSMAMVLLAVGTIIRAPIFCMGVGGRISGCIGDHMWAA